MDSSLKGKMILIKPVRRLLTLQQASVTVDKFSCLNYADAASSHEAETDFPVSCDENMMFFLPKQEVHAGGDVIGFFESLCVNLHWSIW